MAQIREFTSTNASYFILDGVKYPKSYEAVDDSTLNTDRLKVIPIGRTGEQLLYSTHYRNVSVNGNRFNSLEEAISAINEVVFSKGGGSGGGGTTGDYIPLTGTEVGKPVSGDIEFAHGSLMDVSGALIAFNTDQINISNDTKKISLLPSVGGIFIEDESLIPLGLTSENYYGENYTDNTYVQKKYVDDFYTSISGYNAGATQTLKNISGVLTWVTD